jgi:hypothetical protein
VLKIALAGNKSQSASVGAPVVGDTPEGAAGDADVATPVAAAVAAGVASPPPPQLAIAINITPEATRPAGSVQRLPFFKLATSLL